MRLVDAQRPPALARWLAAQEHKAEHVADLGMQGATDAAIWDHALASPAAVVAKGEDFAQRKGLSRTGPVAVERSEPLIQDDLTPGASGQPRRQA